MHNISMCLHLSCEPWREVRRECDIHRVLQHFRFWGLGRPGACGRPCQSLPSLKPREAERECDCSRRAQRPGDQAPAAPVRCG